jgi:hypothetical protein
MKNGGFPRFLGAMHLRCQRHLVSLQVLRQNRLSQVVTEPKKEEVASSLHTLEEMQ